MQKSLLVRIYNFLCCVKTEEPQTIFSWDLRNKNKTHFQNYTISAQTGKTFVKHNGEIGGNCFSIDNCTSCSIFLMDHVDSLYIDDCANCQIFIGPVSSSVFIRGCSNCRFALMCQQFRARDCFDVYLQLFCMTCPVIENCRKMFFSSLICHYKHLEEQASKAKLCYFNNSWYKVKDYTPLPGNYRIIRKLKQLSKFISIPVEIKISDKVSKSLFPFQNMEAGDDHNLAKCLVLLHHPEIIQARKRAQDLIHKLSENDVTLEKTAETKISEDMKKKFGIKNPIDLCVCMTFRGVDCLNSVNAALIFLGDGKVHVKAYTFDMKTIESENTREIME